MAVPSILQSILQRKSEEVAAGKSKYSFSDLAAKAAEKRVPRGFERSLRTQVTRGPAVIAEIKKASPSAGIIRENFQPDAIARSYESAGAACLSVLTDRQFFKGSNRHLEQARAASNLPVLRKDFIIDPWQILESRVLGADCILLIVAALEQPVLRDLLFTARDIGLDVLIEVHDEAEMDRALRLGHSLIGVNNRNLNTFQTSLATTETLMAKITGDQLLVSESGIRTADDVQRMQSAGVNTFLVGEAFMRAPDPGQAMRDLFF